MGKQAVIYARYSTDKQDASSIDDQVRRCSEYAKKNGWQVVEVFSDEAISGAHLERPSFQRLLEEVRLPRKRRFSAVLIDDLSRLSRDLWGMGRVVFEDFAAHQVPVIDVMTGTSSDSPHARQLFAAMGMSNDFFLQMVKAETHRGLEGRALGGFWTGGRVYGYTTIEETNPQDPAHPRKQVIIDEAQALVVRRIFQLFVDGMGLKKIAELLNKEGVPAPYDKLKYGKVNGKGWPHTSVRNLLKNERYIGKWVWNVSKWVSVPNKKNKRRVPRPADEHVVKKYPQLAIVPPELWEAAQARFARRKGPGRRPGNGKRSNVLTGVLRCGTCGGSIGLAANKVVKGVYYSSLGCNAHRSRGDTICANNMTVSEKKVMGTIISVLTEVLNKPANLDAFLTRFNERYVAKAQAATTRSQLDDQLDEATKAVANLTNAIEKTGSDALFDRLGEAEQRLQQLRELKAKEPAPKLAQVPANDLVKARLKNLVGMLNKDPNKAREALLRATKPFILKPVGEGDDRHYKLLGGLKVDLPANPDGTTRPSNPKKSYDPQTAENPASSEEAGFSTNQSCGGRI
jgi:site-specific DNA recombinase